MDKTRKSSYMLHDTPILLLNANPHFRWLSFQSKHWPTQENGTNPAEKAGSLQWQLTVIQPSFPSTFPLSFPGSFPSSFLLIEFLNSKLFRSCCWLFVLLAFQRDFDGLTTTAMCLISSTCWKQKHDGPISSTKWSTSIIVDNGVPRSRSQRGSNENWCRLSLHLWQRKRSFCCSHKIICWSIWLVLLSSLLQLLLLSSLPKQK